MASDGIPAQDASPAAAPVTAGAAAPSQPGHPIFNTTQTDSETLGAEKPENGVKADGPESPQQSEETKAPTAPSTDSAVATSEPHVPAGTQKHEEVQEPKANAEPKTGEKRDLDSTAIPPTGAASAPAPASGSEDKDQDKPAPENPDQPDAKKQKTEQEPATSVNGSAAAANGEPKKAGRPKKEKVKDAAKKAIPTDGIGSRTRSRTQGA
ncbi:uncharacterized protein N7459_001068 [Penicillium hispanicum]|uniref:uncharacterized protein n=1 Tax=Penicillium hispanicum TaxID=1080232 RepID=UPI00253F9DAD|nr:uncharacterized protein N7459_001068 [Penicillium hispanicum]KAJ5594860.1 hypothetical protein N7459_001068 [Penicillium hispanicum]